MSDTRARAWIKRPLHESKQMRYGSTTTCTILQVPKDVAVNILLKHQYAPITKLIDALKGIVMQHAGTVG